MVPIKKLVRRVEMWVHYKITEWCFGKDLANLAHLLDEHVQKYEEAGRLIEDLCIKWGQRSSMFDPDLSGKLRVARHIIEAKLKKG